MSWLNPETVSILLFFIGMAGIIIRKNMMITVVSIGIMDAAIILFFVTLNVGAGSMGANYLVGSADPIPHALMITSIVIGVAIKAIILILVIDLYHEYRTLDWDEARRISEKEKALSHK